LGYLHVVLKCILLKVAVLKGLAAFWLSVSQRTWRGVQGVGSEKVSKRPEFASRVRRYALETASIIPFLVLGIPGASAQPVGASVVAGQAQVLSSGATTFVNQSSSKAIINWQDFTVGQGAAVQFNQPNSAAITLNRVTGGNISTINGAIRANGQVWLLNPNGMLIGNGASINVGGLLATTSDIANQDFIQGRYNFTGGKGSIVNNGTIQASNGGSVILSAPNVTNRGLIQASAGHVVLGGTDTFTVDFTGDHLLSYAVGAGSSGGQVANSGKISAPGGQILLTARAAAGVQDAVINNSGIVEATSVREENGEIILDAGDGTAANAGTLDASGKGVGETGGTVKVLGGTVAVSDGATIDVSGNAGGGTALLGGNFQGTGSERHAQSATIGKATIEADAITRGNGGKVVVWSDGRTNFSGTITARGGAASGNGGQVETSGHELNVTGATITASAANGFAGSWLLDPYDLTVSSSASTATESPPGTFTSASGASVVMNTQIDAELNTGTSVVLQTSGTLGDGNGNGDITVAAPIQMTGSGATSLNLKASGSIIVNQGISSTGGALAVNLDANVLGGGGYVNIAAPIATNGGAMAIGGGATPLTLPAVGTAAQVTGVLVNNTINTGGGALTINGTGYGGSANGNNNYGVQILAAVNTGGGTISIKGIGGNSSGNNNLGVNQTAAITTTTGDIILNGTGAGTGGTGQGYVTTAAISSGTGDISITGSGSASGAGIGGNVGFIASGSISTGGAGTITLLGTGAGAGTGSNRGVNLAGSITAVNGLISITGVSNSTNASPINHGIFILNAAAITSTGLGGILLNGTAGGSGAGGGVGVLLNSTNSLQSNGGGAITITGIGGGSGGTGANNYGVSIANTIIGSGGAITVTGTGGNSSGDFNYGISQAAAITNAGAGSITLNGTGGGLGSAETGYLTNGNVTAGTGNILITGTSSLTATGQGGSGVYLQTGNISTAGTGTVTLKGTSSGNGTGSNNYAVTILGGVTATDGLISVTGTNNSSGNGGANIGVLLNTREPLI
jgi:filamentous hemagglutinin family protein